MSYFEDNYPGYYGYPDYTPRTEPTFAQVEILRRLEKSDEITKEQSDALRAMISYWDER